MKVCVDCGEEKHIDAFYKNRNSVMNRCRSCYVARNRKYNQKYRDANRFAVRVRTCRARAKDQNIPFDLTTDYLKSIWTGVCPAFNIPLNMDAKRGEPGHAQLDKINPSKGYTQGNVVWLSERANRIKDDATIEDLERLTTWLKLL